MATIRIFAFLLILLIIINCALARAMNDGDLISREKRYYYYLIINIYIIQLYKFRLLTGCAKVGSKCGTGLFGKSCCGSNVCNTTIKKCVAKGGGTSWVMDRNGK
jgi:hypothetical protein